MTMLYYLPGFGGSALNLVSDPSVIYWVSYSELVLGYFNALTLAPDGVSPGPPDRIALQAGNPLQDYGGAVATTLAFMLKNEGYLVSAVGYDWRLTLLSNSAAIVARILEEVSAADPCTIVAHSYGGLVARAVWAGLGAVGQTGLVRRIVTIGTPHQGSYGAIQLLSNDDKRLLQITALDWIGAVIDHTLDQFNNSPAIGTAAHVAVCATWPGLYDSMPVLGSADSVDDPNRAAIYQAGNWQQFPVMQSWLTNAATVTGPFLLSPASMPPASVLTTIAGTGYPTAFGLINPGQLGYRGAYGSTDDGDGSVTVDSALVPDSLQFLVVGKHLDIPLWLAQNGILSEAVLRTSPPPPPPMPTVTIPGSVPVLLSGPPSPWPPFGGPATPMNGAC